MLTRQRITETRITETLGLTLMMAILIFAGCGTQDNPLNATTDQPVFGMLPVATDDDEAGVLTRVITRTKLISAEDGGVINVLARGIRYQMKFPAGALSQDTRITIRLSDEDLALFDMKFKPHGTVFLKPVTLMMRIKLPIKVARAINPDEMDIFYNNNEEERWERQRSKVRVKGRWVEGITQIHHFSQYALGGYGSLINKLNYEYVPGYENSYDYGQYYVYYY